MIVEFKIKKIVLSTSRRIKIKSQARRRGGRRSSFVEATFLKAAQILPYLWIRILHDSRIDDRFPC
jgi:hypothetical protein